MLTGKPILHRTLCDWLVYNEVMKNEFENDLFNKNGTACSKGQTFIHEMGHMFGADHGQALADLNGVYTVMWQSYQNPTESGYHFSTAYRTYGYGFARPLKDNAGTIRTYRSQVSNYA